MTVMDTPLTDEEFARLDDFLLSDENQGCLAVDEAHGYMTGLLVGHNAMDETALPETLCEQPAFADQQQKTEITALLQRMAGEIANVLAGDQPFDPLVAEAEEDGEVIELYEGWCFGFMLAVSRHEEKWMRLGKDQQAMLSPIAKLALLHEDEGVYMEDDEYEMLVELLPGSVQGLYHYWAQQA